MTRIISDMMTIEQIGLAKLFLWNEAERIQTWPEAFGNLEEGREYSRRELAEEVFGLVYRSPKDGRPIRGDLMGNCFGFAKVSEEKVVIHGVNAFRITGRDRYLPNREAIEIGEAYKKGDEDRWTVPLARQIARFEVRTRLMLYLLGKGGGCLTFETPEFFALPTVRAKLVRDGETVALFENNCAEFNNLLREHRAAALGPWWERELGDADCRVSPDFRYTGMLKGLPSTNNLNSNIKGGLFLMKYLGVLESRMDGWTVCNEKALVILGEEIARDFVETETAGGDSSLANLKQLVSRMRDNDGFVIASRLAKSWAAQNGVSANDAEEAFDRFMREQTWNGAVRITARHRGQPRHGRGLFGDDGARKIRIEI